MRTYDTLSEAVNDLVKRGYDYNFNMKRNCIWCLENGIDLQPDEFEIDEIHRFEGMTDPGDENILFAISSTKHHLKGTLVNAFGVYADTASAELIARLGSPSGRSQSSDGLSQERNAWMKGHQHHSSLAQPISNWRLALSATLHCLLGCGIGEVIGMVIGMALLLSNVATIVLTISLGFIFGFALGMVPLLRAGFSFGRAFKQVLIAEALSIAVMEGVEVLVAINTPGVMEAHVTEPIFWGGMMLGLAAGFVAAFPVNYIFVSQGIRHQH